MELLLVVANVFHRFEVRLAGPAQTASCLYPSFALFEAYNNVQMEITDGFLRKPIASVVTLKRRASA